MLLFLATYQSHTLTTLRQKDFKLARQIQDFPGLLEALSAKYDTSGLAKVLLMTILRDESIDLDEVSPLIHSMIKEQLKTTYILIQAIIFEGINEE